MPPILAQASTELSRLVLLQDYNTRVVLLGTVLIGLTSGLLGVYLLLRRRALIGDAIAHATLPGVALAYLWLTLNGQDKSLPELFLGAALSGGLGGACVLLLRHLVSIREDAALGIVLSVFFGAGVAIRRIVVTLGGDASGLDSFIFGKAALMNIDDLWAAGIVTLATILMLALLGKEFKLLCFDSQFASSQGWPVMLLDSLLIILVVVVTMVGLQAVGMILIIALLIIPAASARFWTHSLPKMLILSAVFGATSSALGTLLSAVYDRLPSGATIVLAACVGFLVSFALGSEQGLVWRFRRLWSMRREHDILHFLRASYEILEARGESVLSPDDTELKSSGPIALRELCQYRNWSWLHVRQLASRMAVSGLILLDAEDNVQLTPKGILRALESVREHRLLELYMVEEAEAQVVEADREADYLEHGIEPEHLAKLARTLAAEQLEAPPPSPHEISREPTHEDRPSNSNENSSRESN